MDKQLNGEEVELLKTFIEEFFDYDELQKAGFWKGIKKNECELQAERIRTFFGLKTIYEYRVEPMAAHISYVDGYRLKDEPFVTVLPSIYE